MDEVEQGPVATVGEQLRAAREAQGLSIEDVASATRIPTRHLASLEVSDWSSLPAPTYSLGFAKNYATAVGLDREAIAEQLRSEMGGTRPMYQQPSDVFEPADPKRVMPKGLVIGAVLALIVVALGLTWLQNRELSDDGTVANVEATNEAVPAAPAAPAPATSGPVVITASEPAWLEVRDGTTVLKQGEMAAGQSFEVPATAVSPTLTTGKPEALRISVGTADAPMVGAPGKRVSGVSLRAADLLKGPTTTASAPPAPTPAPAARPTVRRPARSVTPAPSPVAPAPAPATSEAPAPVVTNTTN